MLFLYVLSGLLVAVPPAGGAFYRIEPLGMKILGIPVGSIDKHFERASLVDEQNLPAEAKRDLELANDPAFQFALNDDFNADGKPDRAVVGVYRTKQGEEGQFLLLLTELSKAKWAVTYLSKNPGFAGPSVLYRAAGEIQWFPCTACDFGAVVKWGGRRFRTTWTDSEQEFREPLTGAEVDKLLQFLPDAAKLKALGMGLACGDEFASAPGYNREVFFFRTCRMTHEPKDAASNLVGHFAVNNWTAEVWDVVLVQPQLGAELEKQIDKLRRKHRIDAALVERYRDVVFWTDGARGDLTPRVP